MQSQKCSYLAHSGFKLMLYHHVFVDFHRLMYVEHVLFHIHADCSMAHPLTGHVSDYLKVA